MEFFEKRRQGLLKFVNLVENQIIKSYVFDNIIQFMILSSQDLMQNDQNIQNSFVYNVGHDDTLVLNLDATYYEMDDSDEDYILYIIGLNDSSSGLVFKCEIGIEINNIDAFTRKISSIYYMK